MASINLKDKGISSSDSRFKEFSKQIQGNILKGHGRGHTSHIFFSFKVGMQDASRIFIQDFAYSDVTSAYQQEADKQQTKTDGIQRFFIGLYLSASGYSNLMQGVVPAMPGNEAFNKGMRDETNIARLSDPVPEIWEKEYNRKIDGMILIAMGGDSRDRLDNKTQQVVESLNGIADSFVEEGNSIKNKNGDNIEHFGYVDGISQPRFFLEDFTANSNIDINTSVWNPLMPLSLVLTKDPFGSHPDAYGSFLVFRKLEQNVKAFRAAEEQLGGQLGTKVGDTELAGALLVGRHKNGMPVTISQFEDKVNGWPVQHTSVINNFDYSGDSDGARCPFHAHIRKTNPREANNDTLEGGIIRMIARRGITYDDRAAHPNDGKVSIDDLPKEGVGLLFMSFQANLKDQFMFIQQSWANNPDFVEKGIGADPIIGQGDGRQVKRKYATGYGDKSSLQVFTGIDNFVTMKGGEYFFAPSMYFLQNIQNIDTTTFERSHDEAQAENGTAPRKATPYLTSNRENKTRTKRMPAMPRIGGNGAKY